LTAAQLIVLRHGRTAWNATGRFQGQADIGLDDRGRAQAEQAAEVLAELAPTAIYSSDLSRARQTAVPLAARCGLPVHTDERLREIHVGSWEGLTIDDLLVQLDDDVKRAYLAGEDVRRSPTSRTRNGSTGSASSWLCFGPSLPPLSPSQDSGGRARATLRR